MTARHAFLGLALVAYAVWKPAVAFFWRDDWDYLEDASRFVVTTLFTAHGGHVQPLYKVFFIAEAHVFGAGALFYTFVSIGLLAVLAWAGWFFLRLIGAGDRTAWLAATAFAVHPLNFNVVLWIFQAALIIQSLVQVLALICLVKGYHGRRWGRPAGLALVVVQNYCFGNGLLFPFVVPVAAYAFDPERRWKREVVIAVALTSAFATIQALFGGTGAMLAESNPVARALREVPYAIAVNWSRIVLFSETALGPMTPVVALAVAALVLAGLSHERSRGQTAFFVWWSLLSTVLFPLARSITSLAVIPHYYAWPPLYPAVMAIAVSVAALWSRIPLRRHATALYVGIAVVLGTVAVGDQRLVSVFAFRSFSNREAMQRALDTGARYQPFDDPYFTPQEYRRPRVVETYRYWSERGVRNPFEPRWRGRW